MRSVSRTPRQMRWRCAFGLLAYLAVVAAISTSYALGVQALAGALLPADTRYYVPPNPILLLGVSVLPVIFLAAPVVALVSGRFKLSRRRGPTWNAAGAACSVGLLLLGLLGGVSTVRRATDEGVTWRDAFDVSDHRYAWSQVVEVELDTTLRQTRSGWVATPELLLAFSDGRRADFWPAFQPVGTGTGASVITLARMIAARGIPALGPRVPRPQTNDYEAHR